MYQQLLPNPLYLVVWSGGYESPQYSVTRTRKEAWETRDEWVKDTSEDDTLDILQITWVDEKLDVSLVQDRI